MRGILLPCCGSRTVLTEACVRIRGSPCDFDVWGSDIGTSFLRVWYMIWSGIYDVIWNYMTIWYNTIYDMWSDKRYDTWYNIYVMTWYDIWCGMLWHDIWYEMIWLIWCGIWYMILYGMILYDMIWYDIWYDIYDIWYDIWYEDLRTW